MNNQTIEGKQLEWKGKILRGIRGISIEKNKIVYEITVSFVIHLHDQFHGCCHDILTAS